jgi:hypothetical protein
MAVAITRLDGQNTGLRLLGQTGVNPLSLNLTTGEVTSAYLLPTDCLILQEFALTLFQIVPISARSAAALGLLSRLCAVSVADASVLTLSSTVSSGVATLIATVTASPAALVLTIPFAPSGGIMPSSGGGSTPTPPAGDSNLVDVPGTGLAVGDLVYIDGSGDAQLSDCSDPITVTNPCVGIVESIVDPATVSVRTGGVKTGLAGLTPGRIYYLGLAGDLSLTPPVIAGYVVQPVGFSTGSSSLAVAPSTAIFVR